MALVGGGRGDGGCSSCFGTFGEHLHPTTSLLRCEEESPVANEKTVSASSTGGGMEQSAKHVEPHTLLLLLGCC